MAGEERSRPDNWVARKKYEAIEFWDREARQRLREDKVVRAFGDWMMMQLARLHSESWLGLGLDLATVGSGKLLVKGGQAAARAIGRATGGVHRAAAAERLIGKWTDPHVLWRRGVTPRRLVKAGGLIVRGATAEPVTVGAVPGAPMAAQTAAAGQLAVGQATNVARRRRRGRPAVVGPAAYDFTHRPLPGEVRSRPGFMEFPGMEVTARPTFGQTRTGYELQHRPLPGGVISRPGFMEFPGMEVAARRTFGQTRTGYELQHRPLPGAIVSRPGFMEFPGMEVTARPTFGQTRTGYELQHGPLPGAVISRPGFMEFPGMEVTARPTFGQTRTGYELRHQPLPGEVRSRPGFMEFPGMEVTARPTFGQVRTGYELRHQPLPGEVRSRPGFMEFPGMEVIAQPGGAGGLRRYGM